MAQKPKNRKRVRRPDEDSENASNDTKTTPSISSDTSRSIGIVLLFLVAVLAMFSLFDLAGTAGVYIDRGLVFLLGWGKWMFPLVLFGLGLVLLFPTKIPIKAVNYVGLVLFVLSFAGILHLFIPLEEATSVIGENRGGGYFGLFLDLPLQRMLGFPATVAVLIALFVISFLLMFSTSLYAFIDRGMMFRRLLERLRHLFHRDASQEGVVGDEAVAEGGHEPNPIFSRRAIETARKGGKQTAMAVEEDDTHRKRFVKKKVDVPIDLLDKNSAQPMSGKIEENKAKIRETLQNFGIAVEMHDVNVGPTVTQYTLKPDEGVKLTQITTLQNDLALALAAHPIRIEAPIPGKPLVGIEIPNKKVAVVGLREILESDVFTKRQSHLMVALGKDVSGRPNMANIDTMPHLLIAGATGSGKSVCINAMLLSLLYQNTPDTLRLILVDPKRVELTHYNGIPHLFTPVITEVKKTVNALHWAIGEMDRRYQVLQHAAKRNIQSYNASVDLPMPYIVIVIDELADLMISASNDVEASIIRLAQMSRAVGIHLVVATQRPSVDVITGLIKANITTRIAFNVASLVDSRTILDTAGAEKLLGRGDMLYMSAETSKPRRIQGAYVSDKEIERVTNHLKSDGEAEYNEDITERHRDVHGVTGGGSDEGSDDLLDQAKEVVMQAEKASASLLQRRLRIGYARAARILDILEEEGVIGPADGARPREVLVGPVDSDAMAQVDDTANFEDNDEGDSGDSGDSREDSPESDEPDEDDNTFAR